MIDATMYRQMIESLMYLTNTRPDICFVVNTLRHVHLMVAEHAMRYLKGTIEYGIKCDTDMKINLEGYVDLDWAGSAIDKKRTSGCYFSMISERSSEAPICVPDRYLLKEGVLA